MIRLLKNLFTPLIIILAIWELTAHFLGERIFPNPRAAGAAFFHNIHQPQFLLHTFVSAWRATAGILLGLIIAFPLGLLMGADRKVDRIMAPLVFITFPIPKILFLPVLLVILGIGEAPKVLLVALTIGYQILVVTRDSILNVDKRYFDSFNSLWPKTRQEQNLKRAWNLTKHVLIPASLPSVATSLRLASATAIAVLFMAESFATQLGLGYFIIDAWGLMDLPRMFTGIITMGLLGGLFYLLSNWVERKFCDWR